MKQKSLLEPDEKEIVLNTAGVIAALRKTYCAPEYAFLTEVGNSTGFSCRRHADAIAMSLWPSRGMQITGFEVKASRTDWLKELKDGEKADVIYGYCDLWFLAVGDERIVRDGELPAGWGLMVPNKKGTMRIKTVPVINPQLKPLDRGFLGAMLRRAQEQLTSKAELTNEFDRGVKEGEERTSRRVGYRRDELKELQDKVSKFEKASGVNIQDAWDGEQIGRAVQMVKNGIHLRMTEQLGRLATSARHIANQVEVQMKILAEDQEKKVSES
jgi:hypothetical protein